jgi:hypothetical protein
MAEYAAWPIEVETRKEATFDLIPLAGSGRQVACRDGMRNSLASACSTTAGLKLRAELDENKYPKGVKISDAIWTPIQLARHSFHGDWNCTLLETEQLSANTFCRGL